MTTVARTQSTFFATSRRLVATHSASGRGHAPHVIRESSCVNMDGEPTLLSQFLCERDHKFFICLKAGEIRFALVHVSCHHLSGSKQWQVKAVPDFEQVEQRVIDLRQTRRPSALKIGREWCLASLSLVNILSFGLSKPHTILSYLRLKRVT